MCVRVWSEMWTPTRCSERSEPKAYNILATLLLIKHINIYRLMLIKYEFIKVDQSECQKKTCFLNNLSFLTLWPFYHCGLRDMDLCLICFTGCLIDKFHWQIKGEPWKLLFPPLLKCQSHTHTHSVNWSGAVSHVCACVFEATKHKNRSGRLGQESPL